MMSLQEKIKHNVWDKWSDLMSALDEMKESKWSWVGNMKCKYITIRIDMRDMGCIICDKDGNRIEVEDLKFQAEHYRKFINRNEDGDTSG